MVTYTAGFKIGKARGGAIAERWSVLSPSLLLLAAACMPYIDSLQYGFVYDDRDQILATPIVRSWSFVPTYFLKPSPVFVARYYRPLFFLWLRLNYSVWHTRPWGWHFTSILLHVAVCLLVLAVLRMYFKDTRCALVGALVFAVHPSHVETVAWISGCTDSLMAIGILGALLLWMKHREAPSRGWWIGSLVCCALSLLTKETAVILPVLIWLHAFAEVPAGNPGSEPAGNRLSFAVWQALPYAGLVAVFLATRQFVLRDAPRTPDWILRTHAILTIPSLLLFYLRHLIWPIASSAFYDLPAVGHASDPRFWATLVALALFAAAIWIWFRRSRDARVPLASLWFLLPIIPVLNIRPFRAGDFAHDRYLYVPVLGLSVAAGLVGEFLWKHEEQRERAWLRIVLVAVLVVSLALGTAVQARPWKTNLALYTNAVQIAPRNAMARNDLAGEYTAAGQYEKAAEIYRQLVKDYPAWWMSVHNYGYVNFQMGNFALADQYLRRAIQIDPTDPNQYVDLGVSHFQEGRLQDAADELRQGIARNPNGIGYHLILGLVLREQGNLAAARQEVLTEIKNHPDNKSAREDLQKLEKEMASANH